MFLHFVILSAERMLLKCRVQLVETIAGIIGSVLNLARFLRFFFAKKSSCTRKLVGGSFGFLTCQVVSTVPACSNLRRLSCFLTSCVVIQEEPASNLLWLGCLHITGMRQKMLPTFIHGKVTVRSIWRFSDHTHVLKRRHKMYQASLPAAWHWMVSRKKHV